MQIVHGFLFIAGFYPLLRAWQANRQTSLAHAVLWTGSAWFAWGWALLLGAPLQAGLEPWRYLALCLTGAAGIAVLGARRPHVGAWDFVVLGLLAVMLLPLGEHLLLGTPAVDGLRIFFLGATLAVGAVNYVPTAAGPAAVIFGGFCAAEFLAITADFELGSTGLDVVHTGLLLIPWLALAAWRLARREHLEINRRWRAFRDCFGWFWGQRVREQFNRSAANMSLPGYMYWQGWECGHGVPATEAQAKEMLGILDALLRRFEK